MAATASVQIVGSITGTATGTRVIGPITQTSAAANGQVQQVVLQAGGNTINVPQTPAPTGCIITLNPSNTAVTTLKGVSGDTGIALGKTSSTLIGFDPTAVPATFVLNSASLQTGLITEILFY